MAPEHDPADVGVPETVVDAVGIMLGIREAMMLAVLRRPFQRGFLERRRAEEQDEELHDGRGLERGVREQAVVADRDRQAGRRTEPEEERDFRDRDAAVVDIERRPDQADDVQDDEENETDPADSALGQRDIRRQC
jgi:hypothetical protein